MIRLLLGWLAVVFAAVPVLAAQKPRALDPAAGYVLVELANLNDAFFKGTKAPGALTLARYDRVNGDVRGGLRSPESALPDKMSPRVLVNSKPVTKGKMSRLYLVRLEPDVWVIEGANGTAFSLGSYSFEIKAGEILDFGFLTPAIDWAEGEEAKSVLSGSMLGMALLGGRRPETRPVHLNFRSRQETDLALPAELVGRIITPVTFSPDAKFGNYLGGLVNRVGGRAARPDAGSAPASSIHH